MDDLKQGRLRLFLPEPSRVYKTKRVYRGLGLSPGPWRVTSIPYALVEDQPNSIDLLTAINADISTDGVGRLTDLLDAIDEAFQKVGQG